MRVIYGSEPICNVSCPLCFATSGRVLWSVTAEDSGKAFIRPSVDKDAYLELVSVIAGLWGTRECRQVRCDECQCVFAWPHRAGDARFYNLAYQQHMRYPQKRWEFFEAARFLTTAVEAPVLELGAGDGAFVRIMRSAGVPASLINVVEYSDTARAHLAGIDPAIRVFSGLEQFLETTEPNRCSHVFAFQVLEHVERPVEHLMALRRALRTGGLVCMAVPNPARIDANEQNDSSLDMPPAHITRFSPKGLSALAAQVGFEVDRTAIEPVVYLDWLREFLSCRFQHRIQDDTSVQNWMERTLPWRLATVGGAFLSLPAALFHSAGHKEGGSLFCVLRAL